MCRTANYLSPLSVWLPFTVPLCRVIRPTMHLFNADLRCGDLICFAFSFLHFWGFSRTNYIYCVVKSTLKTPWSYVFLRLFPDFFPRNKWFGIDNTMSVGHKWAQIQDLNCCCILQVTRCVIIHTQCFTWCFLDKELAAQRHDIRYTTVFGCSILNTIFQAFEFHWYFDNINLYYSQKTFAIG